MNISDINNFANIELYFWATDVSEAGARIYRWRNERSEFFIIKISNYANTVNSRNYVRSREYGKKGIRKLYRPSSKRIN